MVVPPAMGVDTALNFQPTAGGNAAITGDFVLLAGEVNPVIAALQGNGIAVTALHSHMLTEQPELFYLHFWASDNAVRLAQGLRAALDKTNSRLAPIARGAPGMPTTGADTHYGWLGLLVVAGLLLSGGCLLRGRFRAPAVSAVQRVPVVAWRRDGLSGAH